MMEEGNPSPPNRTNALIVVLVFVVVASLLVNAWEITRPAANQSTASSDPTVPSSLTAEIKTDEAQIHSIGAQMSNLSSEIKSGGGNATAQSKALSTMQANLTSVSTSLATARGQLDALLAQTNSLSSQEANLSAELTLLNSQLDDLNNLTTTLSGTLSYIWSIIPITLRFQFDSFTTYVCGPYGNLCTQKCLPSGCDYLFDEDAWGAGGACFNEGRTGHSRFIQPAWLDLTFNRTCIGENVTIQLYAYWHLDDILIGIDPVNGPTYCSTVASPIDPSDCYLTVNYTLGSPAVSSEASGVGSGNGGVYEGDLYYTLKTLAT